MLLSLLLSSFLTFVELNCENLFDCHHDSLKQDTDFLPEGQKHWTTAKYWKKLNGIGQTILSCSNDLPDVVVLCEVENDTVMRDLTRRSLLRNAGYEYLMTQSPDVRGLDVALLYQPATFHPLCYETIEVPATPKGMRPSRDILYVKGITRTRDTLHVFAVHAPSRRGGERKSRPFRLQANSVLAQHVRAVCPGQVIVMGDFNDYDTSETLQTIEQLGLVNVTKSLQGKHGVGGTYRYQGKWRSLDHILVSEKLRLMVDSAYINDAAFLLEEEPQQGGLRPKRTYRGRRYQHGYSDHLPLVVRFRL